MTVNSKRKGSVGERDAAAAIQEVLGIRVRRTQQYSGVTEDSADLTLSIAGLYVEVKRYARIATHKWLKRAAKDSGGRIPVVLMRENHGDWVVMHRLGDARRLLDALKLVAETDAGRAGSQGGPSPAAGAQDGVGLREPGVGSSEQRLLCDDLGDV